MLYFGTVAAEKFVAVVDVLVIGYQTVVAVVLMLAEDLETLLMSVEVMRMKLQVMEWNWFVYQLPCSVPGVVDHPAVLHHFQVLLDQLP